MEPWKPWDELLAELEAKEEQAKLGGGPDRLEAHKAKGKLPCRERIDALVDPGSFREINMLAETQTFEFDMQRKKILGDGVATGFATIEGRKVLVYAQDVTVPLMLDSTEPAVIEAGLKLAGGKCIVNSVNLEDGEERMRRICPTLKRYGAAVVALTIDENLEEAMGKTAGRKIAIARRM